MSNSMTTKVLQVSEEAAPPVHIPMIVNNELVVLTQQDVRRIEDTRHLSYSRLTPDHQLAAPNTNTVTALQRLISLCQPNPNFVVQMETNQSEVTAGIAKQLEWSKRTSTSAPYPLTYSVGTSTCDLCNLCSPEKSKLNCGCQTNAQTTSTGCNTHFSEENNTGWVADETSC